MSLEEKETYSKLTRTDFVESGLWIDMPEDMSDDEAVELGWKFHEESSKMLKGWLALQRQQSIKEDYQEVTETGLIITDWFKMQVDGVWIIGDRMVPAEPKPEEEAPTPNEEWHFKAYCTFQEWKNFDEIYPQIKEALSEYETYDWDLNVEIAGGIILGKNFVGFDTEQEWREKGVLIESFGFDENMEYITSSMDLLIDAHKEFKKETDKIRENGGPTTFEEARMLKSRRKGEQLSKELFGFEL